jgi:type II secretory pathway component PulF
MSKHPKIFSDFYVSMIKAGEESGHIDQSFSYLADYMDRTYEITSKAKNAPSEVYAAGIRRGPGTVAA